MAETVAQRIERDRERTEWIQAIAAAAPPLTAEQRTRIRSVLSTIVRRA